MLFEDLSLSKSIQKAVYEEGYTHPTPIQEQAIPLVLSFNLFIYLFLSLSKITLEKSP